MLQVSADWPREQHIKQWQPLSKNIYQLRMLTRQVEAVAEQLTVIKNQLHALQHGRIRMKEVEKMLEQQLALLEKQKQKLEEMIEALITGDALLKKKFENILSIKGIGLLSLATIIAETDGFALCENEKQIASYAGYDVVKTNQVNAVANKNLKKR